nr:hypothetical protein Iba_scaffold49799CG0010 [Ipomoea batatas]
MDVEDQVSSGGGVGEADGPSSIGGEDVWKRIEISGVSKYSSSSYISDMEVVVHVDDEIVAYTPPLTSSILLAVLSSNL